MEKKVNLFGALNDVTRLKIIKLLGRGELCVCEIKEALEMTQSAVSHHLKILKQAELVQARRVGKWSFYSLKPGAKEMCHNSIDELFSVNDNDCRSIEEKIKKCSRLDP